MMTPEVDLCHRFLNPAIEQLPLRRIGVLEFHALLLPLLLLPTSLTPNPRGLGAFSGHNWKKRSLPLRPFPRVLLCLLSIPKVTIVHGVGCSLNLNISYYCSSVSWEYRQRLVEHGQAIDPQNLPLSGHPLLQKARTFGLGTPRPPPPNKQNKFQHTVPSHIKSCTAHWG